MRPKCCMNRMITGKKRAFSSLSCKQIGSGRVREREGERAGERERERERESRLPGWQRRGRGGCSLRCTWSGSLSCPPAGRSSPCSSPRGGANTVRQQPSTGRQACNWLNETYGYTVPNIIKLCIKTEPVTRLKRISRNMSGFWAHAAPIY